MNKSQNFTPVSRDLEKLLSLKLTVLTAVGNYTCLDRNFKKKFTQILDGFDGGKVNFLQKLSKVINQLEDLIFFQIELYAIEAVNCCLFQLFQPLCN
jgi:hypothetical protein